MRRAAAAALAALALVAGGCGGNGKPSDPARARLDAADRALARKPDDPRAMAAVIVAAHQGVEAHTDKIAGTPTAAARPFAGRAAAVWPRYLRATRDRPDATVAARMSVIYDQGLRRPREAAAAAAYVTSARPSADAYVRLADLYYRAGDRRRALAAAQRALELADPGDRPRVRALIRAFSRGGG